MCHVRRVYKQNIEPGPELAQFRCDYVLTSGVARIAVDREKVVAELFLRCFFGSPAFFFPSVEFFRLAAGQESIGEF